MLQVNWPTQFTPKLKGNKFAMGVKIKATGYSKRNDSPACDINLA